MTAALRSAPTAASLPCGNGQVDEGEQCDDGNDLDADGCSTECKVHFATGPGSQNAFALDVGALYPGDGGSQLGNGITGAGDVDGNGFEYILVAKSSLGVAYLLLMKNGFAVAELHRYDFGVGFSRGLAALGDLNGDGKFDFPATMATTGTMFQMFSLSPTTYAMETPLTFATSHAMFAGIPNLGVGRATAALGEDRDGNGVEDVNMCGLAMARTDSFPSTTRIPTWTMTRPCRSKRSSMRTPILPRAAGSARPRPPWATLTVTA